MAKFLKLDKTILMSTVWYDKPARDMFITALLMADPWSSSKPEPQLEVRALRETGWQVPPGKYGFVPTAGPALAHRAMVEHEEGIKALERMGAPEPESRSQEHEGRRLVRVNRGYLVLNFAKFWDFDYTAAERSKRYRESKKAERDGNRDGTVTVTNSPLYSSSSPESFEEPDQSLAGRDLSHAQGTPTVWRTLAGWEPPEGLEDEAVMAGVPAEVFRARIAELQNRPIGGSAGVLDRTKYVRQLFGKWKTWAETDRAKATQATAGGFAPRGGSVALLVPEASHERFSAKHGIDLASVLKELNEAHIAEKLGQAGAKAELQKRLLKLAKGKR